jgi:hypothetical protein
MRRVEIIQAAQNVAETLVSSNVMGALARMDTTELVCAHADWVARRQSFGAPEERVVGVLGLSQLDDPGFWAKTLSDGANEDPQLLGPISEMHRHARFAQDELPTLLASLLVGDDGDGADGKLTVLVLEDEAPSTPGRLAMLLSAIDTLYRACARVVGKEDARVSVVACDSGGDKSFEFAGDPVVIGRTKDVLLSFWDRVVFYREDRTEERMRMIAESLPILEDVKAIKEAAAADGARKQVIESVMQFAAVGASIPEIQDVAAYDPRQLMKPKPDMFVAASDTAAPVAPVATEPEPAAPAVTAAPEAAPPAPAVETAPAKESEPAPINGDELRRIVAAKVDKVLHGAEVKAEDPKDAPPAKAAE